jgi:hypothetical protein
MCIKYTLWWTTQHSHNRYYSESTMMLCIFRYTRISIFDIRHRSIVIFRILIYTISIFICDKGSYLVVNMVTFVHNHSGPPTCSQIELNRHKPKQTHLAGCSRVDAADGSTGGERRPLQPLKQQHVSCLVCQQVCQSRKDE